MVRAVARWVEGSPGGGLGDLCRWHEQVQEVVLEVLEAVEEVVDWGGGHEGGGEDQAEEGGVRLHCEVVWGRLRAVSLISSK